jgi:phosphatidylglycerol---prolipoprotein diacylglyceryl transferase
MMVHDPIVRIGIVAVHPFGLFVALGIVLGYVVALWHVPRAGLPARYLPGMLIVVVLGALVTARLAFVALQPDTVRDGLQGILSLWRGGLSLAGGVIGGAVLLALYTWARGEPLWPWADALAPAASLGLTVGMLGLPYSGEGWGLPTQGWFFMHVAPALRPAALMSATRFQPIFAYEAVLFAALTVLLLALSRRQRRLGRPAAGSVGLTFLLVTMLGYGALRPLTLDATHGSVVLQTQMLCAAAAAYAFGLLALRFWRVHREVEIAREIERVQRTIGGS